MITFSVSQVIDQHLFSPYDIKINNVVAGQKN